MTVRLAMPTYRIFRLKEREREKFRWLPHTCGVSLVKPKEYEESGVVEAESPYAAWAALRNTEKRLEVGDLLEAPGGLLQILKYIGFEEAKWQVADAKTEPVTLPAASPASSAGATAQTSGQPGD
ncbi:MAG: hypothetical protein NZV14_13545 [Bryobacteraceae bacterium]|nr:hypothetical protein [Bryobacteraceae bacterium]MDW8379182.1 hypothetical protein [Bryobacterales bacterium]